MNTEQLFFNGINGATGEYLLPPLTSEELSKIAQGEQFDSEHLRELQRKNREIKGIEANFTPTEWINPKNIAETGWGVIFAYNADPAIREALSELLAHRQQQATQKQEHYYQEYIGTKGYRPGESKNQFLGRHRVAPGPVDPDKMPYYLLIVGDPESIPYRFQYQLDVQYAVGRIHFESLDDYAQYARNVVSAETDQFSLPRRAGFFGVQNPNDKATELSVNQLIKPLAEWMAQEQADWQVQSFIENDATKAQLGELLGGSQTPSLLFTASHGMAFPNGHAHQLPHQGALLCQDWPGLQQWQKPIPEDFYFSGDDVSDDARLQGLITFHFACYGAGTPQLDDFFHKTKRPVIAPQSFLARLPQRLLTHPKGGALATIGHVNRTWDCSFQWQDSTQLAVFQSTLKRLIEGHPIGSALEYFNERYAEISSDLSTTLEDIKYGESVNNLQLSQLWTANNDARHYAIVGDPAVRLFLEDAQGTESKRMIVETVTLQPTLTEENQEPILEPTIAKQKVVETLIPEPTLTESQEPSLQPAIEAIAIDSEAPVMPQATRSVSERVELETMQNRLTDALEQFIPLAAQKGQLKTTASLAQSLLDDLRKQRLIDALEDFLPSTTQENEHLKTIACLGQNLLSALKNDCS